MGSHSTRHHVELRLGVEREFARSCRCATTEFDKHLTKPPTIEALESLIADAGRRRLESEGRSGVEHSGRHGQ